MTYKETLEYLYQLGETKINYDPQNTKKALALLGNPDLPLRSVIVAGTNGKGSTCEFIRAIANEAGLKTGVYTSPHLEDIRERIVLNSELVPESLFAKHASELKIFLQRKNLSLSYFEFLTILAVQIFNEAKLDLCIFEMGLGARLDSVNALSRITSILTHIDLDHIHILGDTIEKIAGEKAHVMIKNIPCIVQKQNHHEARSVFKNYALKHEVPTFFEGEDFHYEALVPANTTLRMHGDHQRHNAACAALFFKINASTLPVSSTQLQHGLAKASLNGRLEKWTRENQTVWIDVAHNTDSAQKLVDFFMKEYPHQKWPILMGMLADKDWNGVFKTILPICERLILTKPDSPRAWNLTTIKKSLPSSVEIQLVADSITAFRQALKDHEELLCFGSFYLIGTLRAYLKQREFSVSE